MQIRPPLFLFEVLAKFEVPVICFPYSPIKPFETALHYTTL